MKRCLAAVVAVVALVVITPVAASAADELGVSRDGVTYSGNLSGPLFDPAVRWVPGDVRSATFFARNQGGAPARLIVEILGDHTGALLDSGDLTITASADGVSASVSDGAGRRLLTLPDVDDHEVIPVTITAAFDFDSPNTTQLLSSDLMFRVTLEQTAAILGEGDDDATLPDTGASLPWWLTVLAAVSIVSGAALISRRRTHTQGAFHG